MKVTLLQPQERESPLFAHVKERSSFSIFISIVFALVIVCGLFYSYLYLRNKHVARLPADSKVSVSVNPGQLRTAPATPKQAQIAQDETWTKNGQAIIGGTVRNISRNKLSNLLIELEMKRRVDEQTENIKVEVLPRNLEPDGQGKFSLRVPSHDYSGLRIVTLKDEAGLVNIGFTTVPGASRPVEERHTETKTIIVQRPSTRTRGDEFLNTPDNPEVIR